MRTLVDGLSTLLDARGFASLADVRGRMSQRRIEDPTAFERANYLHILQNYRIGSGRDGY